MNKAKLLDLVADLAGKWIDEIEKENQLAFRSLTDVEINIASRVGVHFPESIKLIEVSEIPFPTDPLLVGLCKQYDFIGDKSIGLTLGYAVYIRKNYLSTRLLSHEFRHVYQYEQAGSVHGFLQEYVNQLMELGYNDAPYELDARKHEFEKIS